MEAIQRAISVFGSQAAMASSLGVRQSTVSEWLRGVRPVPAERCPQIERETRRRGTPILCEELRPDVEWDVLRMQAVPETAPAAEHGSAPTITGPLAAAARTAATDGGDLAPVEEVIERRTHPREAPSAFDAESCERLRELIRREGPSAREA
jgi:DNA-binding transcriptional regulator YdaS (Cro superfamily)